MKKNAITLAVGLVLVAGFAFLQLRGRAAQTPEYFRGDLSLAEARTLAGEQQRTVLAIASADWCGPCQAYKRSTLASPAIADAINTRTIPIMLDVTSATSPGAADAQTLGVSAIPATFLIAPDGTVLAQAVGGLGESELLALLSTPAP